VGPRRTGIHALTALSPHPCGSTHCASPALGLHPSRVLRCLGCRCSKIKIKIKIRSNGNGKGNGNGNRDGRGNGNDNGNGERTRDGRGDGDGEYLANARSVGAGLLANAVGQL
jgi:hypothetical protein